MLPFRTVEHRARSHRVMWNFLSNRKHLNVGLRVMELPVETYQLRSNEEVSTPRLSLSRSSPVRSFYSSGSLFEFVTSFDWKSSCAKILTTSGEMLRSKKSFRRRVTFCESLSKQSKSKYSVSQMTCHAERAFIYLFTYFSAPSE